MSTPEEQLFDLQQRMADREGAEVIDEAVVEEVPELVEGPTLEEQRTEALARAQAKEVALDAAENRAKNLNSPTKEFEHGAAVGIAKTLGMPVDAVNGILTAAGFPTDAPLGSGDNIMDVFAELGVVPEDMPLEPSGVAGGAGEGVAMTLALTPAMLYPFMDAAGLSEGQFARKQQQDATKFFGPDGPPDKVRSKHPRSRAARVAFLLKQMGEQAAKTAVDNPKAFLAVETLAGGAAGAAGAAAREEGASPGVQMAAEVGAGVGSALTLQGIPRGVRSMYRWGMSNLAPMTEAGGMFRAARQTQARAEAPEIAAQRALDAPEGVTPAQATEDPRLMAQERLLLDANPAMDKKVREDLRAAIKRTQTDLKDVYGTPRGKDDWEFAIVNRVNPTDAPIEPGTTEDMITQVYDNFAPLYDEAKGFPVRLHLMDKGRNTTLETMLRNVPESTAVVAGESARDSVHRWLNSQVDNVLKNVKEIDGSPAVMSEDLLGLRSRIRTEQRKAQRASSGGTNIDAADRAELFEVAEQRINQLLKEQLPSEAQETLKTADGLYRNFKVIDNAVWMSNDRGITPDALLRSLRQSASSRGAYTRGEGMELRSMAHAGRPLDGYMNQPDQARRYTAEMSPEDLANTKAQYADSIIRRSILSEVDADGNEILSGARILGNLNKFGRTGEAIGMSGEEMARLKTIGMELRAMQNVSGDAAGALFDDGPSNVVQLIGAMAAARQGTQAAQAVGGNPLVLAGFFTNKMRNFIAKLTSDKATELMIDAVTDKELYNKLLTMPTSGVEEQAAAAKYLNTWLLQRDMPDTEEEENYREDLRRLRKQMEEGQ